MIVYGARGLWLEKNKVVLVHEFVWREFSLRLYRVTHKGCDIVVVVEVTSFVVNPVYLIF